MKLDFNLDDGSAVRSSCIDGRSHSSVIGWNVGHREGIGTIVCPKSIKITKVSSEAHS
jgi:hypothetical protein